MNKSLAAAFLIPALALTAAAGRCASAATSEEITQFQAEQFQKRAELETKLQQRERDNSVKQAETVRQFQQTRITLKTAVDAELAALSPGAQSDRIEQYRLQLADI